MRFIQDFLEFNEGNECPRDFLVWSALAALSSVTNPGVYVKRGYFVFKPNLYICLVGGQGDGKSTAKDIAAKLITKHLPQVPLFTAVMTREAVTKYLGEPDAIRVYKNPDGSLVEYRPIALFINELKNFISVNPSGTIDFLTDIYDRDDFKIVTKNKGTDSVPNPYLVMIACETPDWIRWKLKDRILTGGFGRRVIYVYVTENDKCIPKPFFTETHQKAFEKCVKHLIRVREAVGEFRWTEEADRAWDAWYVENKKLAAKTADPMVQGFMKTKHVQAIKIAMLVALAREELKLVIDTEILDFSIASLTALEANMARLSEGVGANEMAQPTAKILDLITTNRGVMAEKELQRMMFRDMEPRLLLAALDHLARTDQIIRMEHVQGNKVQRVLVLPWAVDKVKDFIVPERPSASVVGVQALPVPPQLLK